MNQKFNLVSLALGTLIAIPSATALGQQVTAVKSQSHQKPVVRSVAPSGVTPPPPTDVSDLPIGIQQGLVDAKRYQEMQRQAERQGQAPPPLPYSPHVPPAIIADPRGVAAPFMTTRVPSARISANTPAGDTYPPFWSAWPSAGSYAPAETPLPGQSLQSPMALPTQQRWMLRQTPPPRPSAPEMSPVMRHLLELQQYIEHMNQGHHHLDSIPQVMPGAPQSQPSGGAIHMPIPSSGSGIRLGRRP